MVIDQIIVLSLHCENMLLTTLYIVKKWPEIPGEIGSEK